MTRMSKQWERRHQNPKRRKKLLPAKTGPKKDNLPEGYKPLENAVPAELSNLLFIAKIK